MSTDSARAYLRTRVLTASPEELRLMLLDGALKFARQGRQGLLDGDRSAAQTGLARCRSIVLELLTSVRADIDPSLAANVRAIYAFLFRELTAIARSGELPRLDRVLELLEYERETWVLLMRRLGRAPRDGSQPDPADDETSAAPAARQRPPQSDHPSPAAPPGPGSVCFEA